ncbi:hypothetical protein PAMP_012607 [Pampus punctatissimus]
MPLSFHLICWIAGLTVVTMQVAAEYNVPAVPVIAKAKGNYWNDLKCQYARPFVCAKDV